jgi:hypothetical protein
VLDKQVRDRLHAYERAAPMYPAMTFAPEGLVLGAGTVLLKARGPRWLQSLQGEEVRVLALLAAAYGRPVPPAVLGNIERAIKSWQDGDGCLAHIHLAHSGLCPPADVRPLACRLFIAENAMRAGVSPSAILQACAGAVEKAYNPAEPRIPAGSGRTSGQWTDGDDAADDDVGAGTGRAREEASGPPLQAKMSPPPPSFLGTLDAAQLAAIARYVLRLATPIGGAFAVFGVLFIPSSNNLRVEGEISGIPGLRFWQNRDEALLHLTYDSPDGSQQTFAAYFDGDELRDEHGKVIGRVLPDGGVLIQSALVSPALVKDDEPRLCPAEGPDKKNELGLEYEVYVKSFVNPPPNTTPTGIGFQLPNPKRSDDLVHYDDCRRITGMMAEAKGSGYDGLLATSKSPYVPEWTRVIREWWEEAGRQIAASDGRPVRWYFADLASARFARELFDSDTKDGRQRIEVVFLPWSWRSRQ